MPSIIEALSETSDFVHQIYCVEKRFSARSLFIHEIWNVVCVLLDVFLTSRTKTFIRLRNCSRAQTSSESFYRPVACRRILYMLIIFVVPIVAFDQLIRTFKIKRFDQSLLNSYISIVAFRRQNRNR